MKKSQRMMVRFINLILLLLFLTSCLDKKKELYIAPWGNNLNKGTQRAPFATINRAMEEVRRLKSAGHYPAGGLTVYLREGEYRLTESIIMTESDGGLPGAPVIYRALPGERVVISGVVTVDPAAVNKAGDQEITQRLTERVASASLLMIDLVSQGIYDFGKNQVRGTGVASSREDKPPDFFIGGKRLQLARWPNEGEFVQMNRTIDPGVDWNGRSGLGESDLSAGKMVKQEPRGGTFTYSFTRPDLWSNIEPYISGVLTESWVWNNVQVSIDRSLRQIRLKTLISYGLIKRKGKVHYFHFEDIPEEIDIPGEYWLDRDEGILYFLPPLDYTPEDEIRVSMLKTP